MDTRERDLYGIDVIDNDGNIIGIGTSAYSVAHAERIIRKHYKFIVKTELLMKGE